MLFKNNYRFKIILEALASGKSIDSVKFGIYAKDTAKLFVELYSWYYMPSSIHKILIHGEKIIEHFIVPIGILSEEAQEARNKNYRSYRLFNSRKFSRKAGNEDVFHMLLVTSDPVISSMQMKKKKTCTELDIEVTAMILNV